ncbi:uncharacterized protein BHQ10_009306 [Talaromyces amestolkiae]|uniref:Uncharacterized protein n=1 Tax=Talaromyces amestolkiae TaxID=1196081 RepID=A0A364LBV6_TALAM|nr:uncharacterized protein BHQ10_009306 [Talaromyces amestolkiae]RAO73294.1 hypothetical protein BHQ10_009306 [Talaromyces amestolkiae]
MVVTFVKPTNANTFGTAVYLQSKHAELQQKWATHSDRVADLWRFFAPSQREAVFRAGVKQGQVLKDPKDRSMFRAFALYPEMNVRDIKGSSDYFLNHFEFRAVTGLMYQYRIGLKGAKGDHQFVAESMRVNDVRSIHDVGNESMLFLDEDKYGDVFKINGEEINKKILAELAPAIKAGMVVPRGVGELILERQCYLFQHICVLVDNILRLGSIIDDGVKEYITPEEEARIAFSAFPDKKNPQPICVQDLITAAVDRKMSFEAQWDLYRSNPDYLANAVNLWYSTRPDLVPDEKGRRMPFTSDEYVSCAIFEIIHNTVMGIAIWDIISALCQIRIEPSEDIQQDIILQEISNICHYEYDRVRKDFKRFAQIGSGSKHFKRLAKVFDNGTPRVVLKSIPDRLVKEEPQLHYILRLCQPENGPIQAVHWNNMIAQLHHNQPLERDKLEEWEFEAYGEVSLTINLVNTLIVSLELPSASAKKGLTYISKLKEVMARLDPLKIHTSLRRFPIFLDDLKHPDTTVEALSIVDRFSEYYAGGSMIALYQNLNKEFLEDLEVQLQEVKGPKKAKGKCSSTKSAEPYGSTTQRQGIHADLALSYDPSLASLSRKLALFFKTKSKVATDFNDFKTTTEWGNSANPESSVWPDTSNEFETSTDQDVPTYYSPPSEAEAFDCLQKQPTTPEDIPRIESPVPKEPSKSASLKSSTRTDLEMSFHAQMPAESDIFSQVDASVRVDASEVLSTTAKSKSSGSPGPSARPNTPTKSETGEVEQEPAEEPELSADALHASLEKSLEATTTEDELFIGPGPYVQLSTSTIMEVLAGLGLSDSDPADEPEIFPSEYIKLDSNHTAKPETSTHSDTDEDITPGTFKVSPRTLQAFSTIFSALEESEADSGSQPGPEYSVKWLDFGTAMKEAGFSILPSLGSLYTFVPGEASDVPTFFTIHRPYRSVIHGDRLLLLALRLKMLYGWSKETFEAE